MVRLICRCLLLLAMLMTTLGWITGCASSAVPGSAADDPSGRYGSASFAEPGVAAGEDDRRVAGEADGDTLLARGRPYQALRSYLAVLGTENSAIRNAGEQIPGILEKCRSIVDRIRIEPLTAGMTVKTGRHFPVPFRAQVSFDGGESGLPDVRLLVKHKIPDGSVSGAESVLRFLSDETGTVQYTPSVPFFEGSGAVYMSLDLDGELAKIAEHGFSGTKEADAFRVLRSSINAVQAVFPYRVESSEGKVVLGILIVDRDNAGNPTGGGYTASGISGAFDSAVFDVEVLDAAEAEPDADYREIARSFGDSHGRSGWLVYGDARISEYEERGGRIYITVTGFAGVINLKTDRPAYETAVMKKSVIGSNFRSTVLSAYRQLGKLIGAELVNHLK